MMAVKGQSQYNLIWKISVGMSFEASVRHKHLTVAFDCFSFQVGLLLSLDYFLVSCFLLGRVYFHYPTSNKKHYYREKDGEIHTSKTNSLAI